MQWRRNPKDFPKKQRSTHDLAKRALWQGPGRREGGLAGTWEEGGWAGTWEEDGRPGRDLGGGQPGREL